MSVATAFSARVLSALILLGAGLLLPAAASAQTLEKVKARGSVNCGVNPALPGFSARDAQGNWSGFDIDLCRALAAAIFNDPGKVQYTPLSTTERLPALQADKIDVLSRNTTWTFSREAPLRLNFTAVTYYDGQGFLVRRSTNATSALDGDDLEPGVDGGSTDNGLPFYLRRQAVYYRTVYSPGMIVVDRSQRFLYLVQPQARAWRYGIGVGGECDVGAGLYRIQSKSHWPEWTPSPALLKRRKYPDRVAGGPGNPLGAYAMYFESSIPGIHGTNAPKSIGQAPTLGCFRLVNDDVVDLEKRIAIGTGVVVLN